MPRPEFRVLLGKLPKSATSESLTALLGAHAPAELELFQDELWTSAYAIAFYHDAPGAAAAAAATRGAALDSSPVTATELSKEQSLAKAVLVRGLPRAANEEMLEDYFSDYQPRDFGKRTEAWGFAVLRFSEANAALACANDTNGLEVGDEGSTLAVRCLGRSEEIALEKEIRRLKRAQYSADAKLDVIVGNVPPGTADAQLAALFADTQGGVPHAPVACEVKRHGDDADWGFAVLQFEESAHAWAVCDATGGRIALGAQELTLSKLYAKDKPKPPPPAPSPAPPPEPAAPDPEIAKRKMMLMRKLKGATKVAGMQSRVRSITKAKINDPKMSLNNRLSQLEDDLKKLVEGGGLGAQASKALEARVMQLENYLGKIDERLETMRSVTRDAAFQENMRTFITDEGFGANTEAAPRVDTDKIASSAVGAVMRELETIGLLIQDAQGAYEISDAIMGSAMLAQLEPIKDSLSATVAHVQELRAVCERKVEKDQLKTMCESMVSTEPGEPGVTAEQNPLLRVRQYIDERNEEIHQNKADKLAVDKRMEALKKTFKTEMDEGLSQQNASVQEALSQINSNAGAIDGKIELLERDVTSAKEKLANDPLPALVEEQKQREKDMYQYIEGQMARFGLQQEDIARMATSLDEKPSEKQVRAMMASLHDKLQSKYGNSDAVAMMVESLKLDVRRKTTREDVLRLVGASVKEMADQLKLPDDTLMAGRLQFRCLVCNHSLPQMHDGMAEKVVHAGLTPESSAHQPSAVPQMFKQPNQLVLATYPNGRAGALRPLQRHQGPATPMGAPVDGIADASLAQRQSKSGKRAQTASGARPGQRS